MKTIILVLLMLVVIGCGDTYEVHRFETIDTVYADTLYDTTYIETYIFENANVNLIYGSHIEGGLCIKSDSTNTITMGTKIQSCFFEIKSEDVGYQRRTHRGDTL